jgi:hypothetical protein
MSILTTRAGKMVPATPGRAFMRIQPSGKTRTA